MGRNQVGRALKSCLVPTHVPWASIQSGFNTFRDWESTALLDVLGSASHHWTILGFFLLSLFAFPIWLENFIKERSETLGNNRKMFWLSVT